MSFSWVDPHFAALYARREEERLAERLVSRVRERAVCEPILDPITRREPTLLENEFALGAYLRVI